MSHFSNSLDPFPSVSPVNQSVRNEIIDEARQEATAAALEYNTEDNRRNISDYADIFLQLFLTRQY